jgi:hypothetical protein
MCWEERGKIRENRKNRVSQEDVERGEEKTINLPPV